MKQRIIHVSILLIALLVSGSLHAQVPSPPRNMRIKSVEGTPVGPPGQFQWQSDIGSTQTSVISSYKLAADASGNVYMIGSFEGHIILGTAHLIGTGLANAFIAKFSPSGIPLWAKQIGNCYGRDIKVNSNGEVVILGYFQGTMNFGAGTTPLTSNAGSYDIFIAKFSADWVHLWSKRYGGTGNEYGLALALNQGSELFVTGYCDGLLDFGSGPLPSFGGYDMFLSKFSSSGGLSWVKRFGGPSTDFGWAVATGPSDAVVITGSFQGTANFSGLIMTSAGNFDIAAAKFFGDGSNPHVTRFGSTGEDRGQGVAIDGSGNIFLIGMFTDAVDFGSTRLTSFGRTDIFLTKLNAALAPDWSKGFGSSPGDNGYAVTVDRSGNVILAGMVPGAVNFGDQWLPGAGNALCLAKFSNAGSHQWSMRADSAHGNSEGWAVATDLSDNVYATGIFQYSVSFGGPTLTATFGNTHGFLVKFGP